MNPKRYYLVQALVKSRDVQISGSSIRESLDLVWADGMVGVCPMFSNKKAAKKYAGERFSIVAMEEVK